MSDLEDKKNYLEVLDKKVATCISDIEKLSSEDGYKRLHELLKNIALTEEKLRKFHRLGKKLQVIRQQLQILLTNFEKETGILRDKKADLIQSFREAGPNEMVIYVLLFNAKGDILKTWERTFLEDALADHSVNRPIYLKEEEIIKVITVKAIVVQHAYLAAVVNKADILSPTQGSDVLKDHNGFALLKLKEGAIKKENLQEFYHGGKHYRVRKGVIEWE